MTRHDRDLAGAYALNALSTEDRAAYERAIEGSEEARSEATELQDTAVILGLSVAPVEPPAALRARLLETVATTPQRVDVAPTPAEHRARARWSRPITVLTSAAAALALIVAGVAVGTTSLHPEPSFQDAQMAAIKRAPDVQELQAELATGQTVTLRWSHALASSAVIVDDFEPAPRDMVYQLWYIDADGARPAGILSIVDDGRSWRVLDGTMDADDMVGVTIEPGGGSQQPTTDPIVMLEP